MDKVHVGVAYYPEHWDQNMWDNDAQLMRDSGVTVVRLAEFAWSRMELSEGIFDFDWLHDAVELFHQYGISVVLGTPTMTPPHWLVQKHPDVLPDFGQSLLHPGVRGHRCYNSPSMRKHSAMIIEQMAHRFAGNEAIIGWQTDNEFMLHMCRCSHCKDGFHDWLLAKYGTLEEINRQWGTAVWSGEFNDWEQIRLFPSSERHMNPSLLLDYRRFQNESVMKFQQIQIDMIRQLCPGHFITHNAWGGPLPLDYKQLYENLDFASFDYYPSTYPNKTDTNPYSGALSLDRTRGFKNRNYWVMEQFGGMPGSWMSTWRSPYPGFLRAYAWQSIARGADGVVFFRWRSAIAGAEQFWHGLLEHSNVPGRRFEEFQRFGKEVGQLSHQLWGTELKHKVAIYYDVDSHSALQLQPQVDGMDYYENLKTVHRALVKLGIGVDVVSDLDDLDRYRIVVVPSLFVLDDNKAALISDFVKRGGIIIGTPRTGVKSANNQCHMMPLPSLLAGCFGVHVKEYDPIGADEHSLINESGTAYACTQWNDLLEPTTSKAIAWYDCDFYKGSPAITVNEWGDGKAYYIGTFPDEGYYSDLFVSLAEGTGIEVIRDMPEGLQVTYRSNGSCTYMFILNLSREEKTLSLEGRKQSLFSGNVVEGELKLPAYGVEIFMLAE